MAIVQRLELNKFNNSLIWKELVDARITSITEDNDGKFWMASRGLGLVVIMILKKCFEKLQI